MMNHVGRTTRSRNEDVLEVWLPLLLCMALAGTWYHVLRLRERAILHARHVCEQHGLPLLDDSVALHRVRASWQRRALQVTREYRFETSLGGHDRQAASVTLVGDRVVGVSLPQRDGYWHDASASSVRALHDLPPAQADTAPGNNVVPLTGARRTLH